MAQHEELYIGNLCVLGCTTLTGPVTASCLVTGAVCGNVTAATGTNLTLTSACSIIAKLGDANCARCFIVQDCGGVGKFCVNSDGTGWFCNCLNVSGDACVAGLATTGGSAVTLCASCNAVLNAVGGDLDLSAGVDVCVMPTCSMYVKLADAACLSGFCVTDCNCANKFTVDSDGNTVVAGCLTVPTILGAAGGHLKLTPVSAKSVWVVLGGCAASDSFAVANCNATPNIFEVSGDGAVRIMATCLLFGGTIPTSDPCVAGQVYCSTGALMVSAG